MLEAKGVNSRNEEDVLGRRFDVPVDHEHKAKQKILRATVVCPECEALVKCSAALLEEQLQPGGESGRPGADDHRIAGCLHGGFTCPAVGETGDGPR